MLDLECLEDDDMAETNDILNSMNKAMDTVSKVTGDISLIGNLYNKRQEKKESGELNRIKQEIERYDRKMKRLIISTLTLWVVLVIATSILCIAGNDIVLSFLHI